MTCTYHCNELNLTLCDLNSYVWLLAIRYSIFLSILVFNIVIPRGVFRPERIGNHYFGKNSKIFGTLKNIPIPIPNFGNLGIFRKVSEILDSESFRNFWNYFGIFHCDDYHTCISIYRNTYPSIFSFFTEVG